VLTRADVLTEGGGREVPGIDKRPGSASHRRAFLPDPTGRRCYERRSVAFGDPRKGFAHRMELQEVPC
jgi:hypothetical protein